MKVITKQELYTELGKRGRRGAKKILASRVRCHANMIRNVLCLDMPSSFEREMIEEGKALVIYYEMKERAILEKKQKRDEYRLQAAAAKQQHKKALQLVRQLSP